MIEILLCMAMFVLVFALFLCYAQNRRIYFEQNGLIASLRGESLFLMKEHKRDIELLNWADKAGHYDIRFESLREELRSAMEKDSMEV